MFHGDRAGEDDRVGNDDLASFFGGDDGCARLDVIDRAFDAVTLMKSPIRNGS
jgi:hypothetical protein